MSLTKLNWEDWLEESHSGISAMLSDAEFNRTVSDAASIISEALRSDRKILVCGNGGSAGDAGHFVGELINKFTGERHRALPGIDLTAPVSTMTAIANDSSYKYVFSRQVEALGEEGDVLFGISTSGTSPNVLHAIDQANGQGLSTILLTSILKDPLYVWDNDTVMERGRPVSPRITIQVPPPDHPYILKTPFIQQAHIMIIHWICAKIDRDFK